MDMLNKHIIFVLGMHRSGTSAITRGLQVLGVDLGNTLMPAVENNNDKGFWEDIEVNELNISILEHLGYDWYSLEPTILDEKTLEQVPQSFKSQAAELLRKKLSTNNILGIKDPRFSRLLPFWKHIVKCLNVKSSYLIALRNPKSVAHSLARRDGFELTKGYYLWLEYMLDSLRYTREENFVFVDYDALMIDPSAQLQRIADNFQLTFESYSDQYIQYKSEYLDEKLRHTSYHLKDISSDPSIPPIVSNLYKLLKECACEFDCITNKELDITINQFTEKLQETSPLLQLLSIYDNKILKLEDESKHLNRLVRKLDNQVDCQSKQLSIIIDSKSWQITAPFRWLSLQVRQLIYLVRNSFVF